MSSAAEPYTASQYDGELAGTLAERWGLAAVHAYDAVGSTLDVAHRLAPGAASGTLVLAHEQTAGRGRHGHRWSSAPGAGVWLTLIERPVDVRSLDVMALRCGLHAAEALDTLAPGPISVKWPNDLYVRDRKLAGILIETRWRGTSPEWVAIGFGLNVTQPDVPAATGLAAGVSRLAALDVLIPALRRAAAATHHLSAAELSRWAARDMAAGRVATAPAPGTVQGIAATGELLIESGGLTTAHRSGSLTFAE
ncbi:MAG: biotin/acetyl-CoA-carboxylase ligase [Gemmatimonadetes bacterium]|nr:biotin/acetyl-CoA-carboxylase ligase [Gemmatimonadota bacterium]